MSPCSGPWDYRRGGVGTGEGGMPPSKPFRFLKLATLALPFSPSKNFVLLVLLPFGQSHSPMAILP